MKDNTRGRLIMACGTGKTFTSLRIAEEIVPDGGSILFLVPVLPLCLNHDGNGCNTLSGRCNRWRSVQMHRLAASIEDSITISELICEVSTDPFLIAQKLKTGDKTKVIFSTYQSLDAVIDAIQEGQAPARFDLVIVMKPIVQLVLTKELWGLRILVSRKFTTTICFPQPSGYI